MGAPLAQATAHANRVVAVYEDRIELRSGWQGQDREEIRPPDVASVRLAGWVNCTLTIESNTGRVYRLERMALPDARAVKAAIERQKQRAGAYG